MNFFEFVSLVEEVETKEETQTGVARGGLTVECKPDLMDREIIQRQSRVVCLTKPYEACSYCPHASFTILFKTNKEERTEQVACPRWTNAQRNLGQSPDGYVAVEMATCADMPFEFCPSCPSRKNVAVTGADKAKPGWYSRWHRVTKDEEEDDD